MSNTSNFTADILRQLADVAEGKKDLNEVVNSVTSDVAVIKKIKENYNQFKEIISTLKRNVKEQVKDEIRKNDLDAKFETSSALAVKDADGNVVGYMGLKSKEKKAWIDRIKENLATSFHNNADLLTDKKTFKQVQKEQWAKTHQDYIETSATYRHASGFATGVYKGVKKTIEELRGTQKPTPVLPNQIQPSKYAGLDETQFRVALGSAYDNFARLEHFNVADDVKKEVLQEINLVLEEAKKRYPDAVPENTQGSYFKDKDVANMEQQLMPYMREAAKSDNVFAQDVNRFESWRNGKDATIMSGPSLTVNEMPFENVARWGIRDKTVEVSKQRYGNEALDFFNNPYRKAKNTLSQEELAAEMAKVAKLNIR